MRLNTKRKFILSSVLIGIFASLSALVVFAGSDPVPTSEIDSTYQSLFYKNKFEDCPKTLPSNYDSTNTCNGPYRLWGYTMQGATFKLICKTKAQAAGTNPDGSTINLDARVDCARKKT